MLLCSNAKEHFFIAWILFSYKDKFIPQCSESR